MSIRFFDLIACVILFLTALTVLEPNVLALSPSQEVGVLELYRTRLAISTDSDWTTVHLVGGAELGGIRLEILEGQNAPKLTYSSDASSDLVLGLNKKQYDETTVKIQVTLTLTNVTSTGHVTFQSQKGDLGGITMSIYNFNGDQPILVSRFVNSVSGRDLNSQVFSVGGKDLVAGGPLYGRRRDLDKLVWAFYYPWYGAADWSSPVMSDVPIVGSYESSNATIIEKHIRMAKSAGIDGFIVSWCTDWCPSYNLDAILDVASRENFKISIYLESLQAEGWSGVPRTKASLESMLLSFFQRYGADDRYYRADGRPVIFVWAVDSQSIETWQEIIGDLNHSGYRGFYVAETSNVACLQVFDGIHVYGPLMAFKDLTAGDRALSLSVASYSLLYLDSSAKKLWAATITPGYDERKIPERAGLLLPREDGGTYQGTFDAALKSDPDWVLITSFNEWWENTYIEPSVTYGWKYIDLTTIYSSEFKEVKFLPSLQVSRKVAIEGQEGKLNVVIANNGNGSAIGVNAKDHVPTGNQSAESLDRMLPGEELRYTVSFNISADRVSLQLPPGEVTSLDAYGNIHHLTTRTVVQYHLAIVSPYGSPSGVGWYEANATASLSVSPTSVPVSGILGALGARYVFDRWSGDLATVSPNATIVMDAPKTAIVLWHTDYTEPYAIVGIVSILILVAAICIKTRRSDPAERSLTEKLAGSTTGANSANRKGRARLRAVDPHYCKHPKLIPIWKYKRFVSSATVTAPP
jgi:hypothetical protein